MKNMLTLLFGAVLSCTAIVPSAAAYNGFVSDIRYGEHPYETRKRDEDRRKRLAEDAEMYGSFRFDSPTYYDPIYAKRSVLHPFYRKGGTSQYQDYSRFTTWRGYLDPALYHEMSPDTYCSNFSYQRDQYRGAPQAYYCFR